MIKLEHVVLPSPEQMDFVIEGMRNAHDSWDKSDSNHGYYIRREFGDPCSWSRIDDPTKEDLRDECVEFIDGGFEMGSNDLSLMNNLSGNGPVHSKYMRMMIVMVRITAPLYWWKEFDTYKVGTVSNSCSTMHKLGSRKLTSEDCSTDHLLPNSYKALGFSLKTVNEYRDLWLEEKDKEQKKKYWWQMIQLLPSSYNQTRNVMLDYEVLKNIYTWRKDHKLDEWVEFCKWIETLPYSEIITGGNDK